ncbi:LysR family transcriptional regulator [Brenneria izbisi]|uniref:LysR family transcriptional regulator n=1 Tax=Brenneria izbisi TaxID=2939450 RepID=A0AA42C0X4_9GAMM|nr:LysR family transcriptional regulator [Brenneria izbisi]MCV9877507.1 LysR family transcriptional regulator [Brenneria izbisi]MCV9880927.1 LysR family transcriptional regulator [Brenneria izbisi]
MSNLESMKVFVTVTEVGSFSAASSLLNISPVMVGKHIKYLEKKLKVRLINRTTRKQSLTEAGRLYLNDCKDILEKIKLSETIAERLDNAPRGKIRITAPNTLGSTLVTQALVEFIERFRGTEIELLLDDNVSNIIEEGIDVAIRIGDLQTSSYLVAKQLKHYSMRICASPQYVKENGIPSSPAELKNHNCLTHLLWNENTGWESLFDSRQRTNIEKGNFSTNNGLALRKAALAGAGLVMLPNVLMAQDIENGRLVSMLDDFLPPPRKVHLLYPYQNNPLPKIRSLVDFLVKKLG